MSQVTIDNNTGSQVTFSYDVSKIFLFQNTYRKINIDNGTGSDVTLQPGTLIGTISATGKGKVLASGSTDGSQLPTGIVAQPTIVPANSNVDVYICIGGRVAQEKLIFNGSDTLNTSIADTAGATRILQDRIASDTMGIELISASELSGFDNV